MYIEPYPRKNLRRANNENLSRFACKHFQVSPKNEKNSEWEK